MKQTALDFLIEKLDNNLDIKHSWRTKQYIEQAKEMEKQQQKSNWMGGYLTRAMKDHNLPYGKEYLNLLANKEIEAEQYYQQTFKTK
jgi:urease accessory protein UreF